MSLCSLVTDKFALPCTYRKQGSIEVISEGKEEESRQETAVTIESAPVEDGSFCKRLEV